MDGSDGHSNTLSSINSNTINTQKELVPVKIEGSGWIFAIQALVYLRCNLNHSGTKSVLSLYAF